MVPKKSLNPINGWMNLYKPPGMSSAQAVGKVKWLLRPRKIGHAGTLDPLATGVLPLALGEGTKCVNMLMDAKKTYTFSVTFGERRSTDDAEGAVVARCALMPTEAQLRAILPRFTGEISQLPPAYSAIKVGGKRAYALARAGQEVTLQPRPVTIYALELVGYEAPAGKEEAPPLGRSTDIPSSRKGGSVAHFRATVSKGTYIRSLGRDIAQACGAEGYISRLHRAAVGAFTDAEAISLDFLEKSMHNPPPAGEIPGLLPLRAVLDDIPALALNGQQYRILRHGQHPLLPPTPDAPLAAALVEGELVALARIEANRLIPLRLLNV